MVYKEENGSLTFNVSQGLANFSQRNNQYIDEISNKNIAMSMCNITSYCMAYSYVGGIFPNSSKKYTQEEDKALEFIRNDKDTLDYYKSILPAFYNSWRKNEVGNYPPEQIHTVLNYGFNRYVGWKAASFNEKTDINNIIKEIVINGRPMVLSGKFGNLNHIVCLVGIVAKKEILDHLNDNNLLKQVTSFIIDDPYGDFHTGYSVTKGNDIQMSVDEFLHIFKPIDDRDIKMCHYFYKPHAVI